MSQSTSISRSYNQSRQMISVFVCGPEGATLATIRINKTATVRQLMEEFLKMTTLQVKIEDLRLIFAGRQLDPYGNATLEDCDIVDMSTVNYVVRVLGGASNRENSREFFRRFLSFPTKSSGLEPLHPYVTKSNGLKPLPPHVTITYEPDEIGADDDPNVARAKMFCGHVMSIESMQDLVKSHLNDVSKVRFMCPYTGCGAEWPFAAVRHVAMMKPEELKPIEKRLNLNYLRLQDEYRRCPGCKNWCERAREDNKRALCQVCTRNNGGVNYEFCWICMRQWTASGTVCNNGDCGSVKKLQETLITCAKKDIPPAKNVPSYRLCPNCKTLIEHKERCKHVRCISCQKSFCFVCLKPMDASGKWQCGSYNDLCTVAPVQNIVL